MADPEGSAYCLFCGKTHPVLTLCKEGAEMVAAVDGFLKVKTGKEILDDFKKRQPAVYPQIVAALDLIAKYNEMAKGPKSWGGAISRPRCLYCSGTHDPNVACFEKRGVMGVVRAAMRGPRLDYAMLRQATGNFGRDRVQAAIDELSDPVGRARLEKQLGKGTELPLEQMERVRQILTEEPEPMKGVAVNRGLPLITREEAAAMLKPPERRTRTEMRRLSVAMNRFVMAYRYRYPGLSGVLFAHLRALEGGPGETPLENEAYERRWKFLSELVEQRDVPVEVVKRQVEAFLDGLDNLDPKRAAAVRANKRVVFVNEMAKRMEDTEEAIRVKTLLSPADEDDEEEDDLDADPDRVRPREWAAVLPKQPEAVKTATKARDRPKAAVKAKAEKPAVQERQRRGKRELDVDFTEAPAQRTRRAGRKLEG